MPFRVAGSKKVALPIVIESVSFIFKISQARLTMEASILFNSEMMLGEGPVWDHRTGKMYCVDILGNSVHYFNPDGSGHGHYDVGKKVGFAIPTDDNRLACGVEDGFGLYDPKTKIFEYVAKPEPDQPGNRFNDGKCDAMGRIWGGTMNMDESKVTGNLYRISHSKVLHQLSGIGISNGLDWSPDTKTFYYIDSPTCEVKAFDFDLESGTIYNPRVIIRIDESLGFPDGMTVDREGMLWIAHWGGYCVRRWNPLTADIMMEVPVPAPQPTSCCFGGEELNTLFITSARKGLDAEMLKRYPSSGAVFVWQNDVAGKPGHMYKP